MTLTLHDATHMDGSELDWPNITAALKRLEERFPNDCTLESLLMSVVRGQRTMWLVRDGGVTVSVVLTEIETVDCTGFRRLVIKDMGGEHAIEALPMIDQIEEWGREHGAVESDIYGRVGWTRPLAAYGYAPVAVTLRKRL